MTPRGFPTAARLVLLALIALALAACNTAGGPNDDDDDDDPQPGTLIVNVSGLPAGVDADIDVSGPGFSQSLTASATLEDLEPGQYTVLAQEVVAGSDSYAAQTSGSPATVTEGGTATVDVDYALVDPGDEVATQDDDFAANPAIYAQFRNTGTDGAVWFDEPQFNEDPFDLEGLQYRNAISIPGDETDWLQFDLLHGQAPTTNVQMTLECDPDVEPTPIRVHFLDENQDQITPVLVCGDTHTYAVQNSGGTTEHFVLVAPLGDDPHYTEYVLSIDVYCFQECTYEEFSELGQ